MFKPKLTHYQLINFFEEAFCTKKRQKRKRDRKKVYNPMGHLVKVYIFKNYRKKLDDILKFNMYILGSCEYVNGMGWDVRVVAWTTYGQIFILL